MASIEVVNAVEGRLAALWTLCPVIGLNLQEQAPSDAGPFLQVQYPLSDTQQITIGAPGNNVFRETGAFRFVLNIQRNAGLQTGLTWAGTLAALFRGKQFGTPAINTWAPTSPANDDGNDDGNYWLLSFSVPYYFDSVG